MPGGGVQLSDRSPKAAPHRELREELGATAEVGSVVFERELDSIRREIFYTAELTDLDLALRDGPEFLEPSRGTYEVDFVPRDELAHRDLRPTEILPLIRYLSI